MPGDGSKQAALLAKSRATGLKCPTCGASTRCIDSRPSEHGWRRRRGCPNNHRFTSYEVICEPTKDMTAEIWRAKKLMAQATEAMLALDVLLSRAQDRAELVREFEASKYGNAAPRGNHVR